MSLTSIHLPPSIKIEAANESKDYSNSTYSSVELFSSPPVSTPFNESILLSPSSFSSEEIEPIEVAEEEKHISASTLKEFLKTLEAAEIVKSSSSGFFLTATALLVVGFLALQNDSLAKYNTQASPNPPPPCFNITVKCPALQNQTPPEISGITSFFPSNTNRYFKECSDTAKKFGNYILGFQQACVEIKESEISLPTDLSKKLLSYTYTFKAQPILSSLTPFNGTSSLYDQIHITCTQIVDKLKHPSYDSLKEKLPTDCNFNLQLNNIYHTPYKGETLFYRDKATHHVSDLSKLIDIGSILKAFEAYNQRNDSSLILKHFV